MGNIGSLSFHRQGIALIVTLQAIILVALFLFLPSAHRHLEAGQKGYDLAMSLRPNVVHITVHRLDMTDSVLEGFGFIVAKNDGGRALIVTAAHLVSKETPTDINIQIRFFSDQGRTYPAALLETIDHNLDLAVLEAPFPTKLDWVRKAMGPKRIRSGLFPVRFIGSQRDWYVPRAPGYVNDSIYKHNFIIVDGLNNIVAGSSGSPLISERGIIGMIVVDKGAGVSYATRMTLIKQALLRWNYPWHLEQSRAQPLVGNERIRILYPRDNERISLKEGESLQVRGDIARRNFRSSTPHVEVALKENDKRSSLKTLVIADDQSWRAQFRQYFKRSETTMTLTVTMRDSKGSNLAETSRIFTVRTTGKK